MATRRRRRRKKASAAPLILLIIVLLFAAVFFLFSNLLRIKGTLTLQAGIDSLNISDFVIFPWTQASFETDVTSLDLSQPGTYEIQIRSGGRLYSCALTLEDTVAPQATPVNKYISYAETLEPMEFVTDLQDATHVTAAYTETPPFGKNGTYSVGIILTDAAGNTTQLTSQLVISNVRQYLNVEAGGELPDAEEFVLKEASSIRFDSGTEDIDFHSVGIYPIKINVDGRAYHSEVRIVDTVAPTAEPATATIWENDTTADAMQLVANVQDETSVTAAFKEAPPYGQLGEYTVTVVLTDEGGNTTEVTSRLIIRRDTEAPQIWGVFDQTIYVGDTISYRSGVYGNDNRDGEVTVEVDTSRVNLTQPGQYEVIYTARDAAGNVATQTAVITILAASEDRVTQEMLDARCDELLAQITTEDMTMPEKMYAVYVWARDVIVYTGQSDKSDWVKEAYHAMETHQGDCFTYYAVSRALLNRLGLETMTIQRLEYPPDPQETTHYWNLVNYEGHWYHFDPRVQKRSHPFDVFMLTDEELDQYRIKYNRPWYYYYDTTKVPASETVSFTTLTGFVPDNQVPDTTSSDS